MFIPTEQVIPVYAPSINTCFTGTELKIPHSINDDHLVRSCIDSSSLLITIAQIAQDYNISLQQYADDTLLYLGLSTSSLQTATSRLECCLSSLHAWFCCNGMCLNPMKSEANLLGSSRCLQSFPVIRDVSIASSVLPTTDKVTTLGVILDSKLTFDAHTLCPKKHVTTFSTITLTIGVRLQ